MIISIDTLRADHLSLYGYSKSTSPNIDRLARRSHVFQRAYTTMPTTLPAHTTMLTGLYPEQLGVTRNGLQVPSEAVTLAELLKSSGFRTAGFVSAAPLFPNTKIDQGFELFDAENRPGGETINRSLEWISAHAKERFFAFIHLYDPHTPYYAPPEFRRSWEAPEHFVPTDYVFLRQPKKVTPAVVAATTNAYDAEIAYADAEVGRLLRLCEELSLTKNTVVIVVSDHGESLDELLVSHQYAFDHGEFLYAHQLRVPLIISEPYLEVSRVHETPVSLVDLMPTALEILEVPIPDRLPSRSLVPLLRGRGMTPSAVHAQRRSFKQAPRPFLKGRSTSLIFGQWHLIQSEQGGTELFDLTNVAREKGILLATAVSASSETSPPNVADLQKTAENLGQQLKDVNTLVSQRWGEATPELDPEVLKRLRSLGYVE